MGPMGAVAPTGIFGIFFFYIKVLEVLTIVAPTENLKKKLQLKVLNPIHIPIGDCPHLSKIFAPPLMVNVILKSKKISLMNILKRNLYFPLKKRIILYQIP